MSPLTSQQLLELAMEHHRSGRLAEAEQTYRHLLAVHPRESDVLHLLGVLAGHAGDPRRAVELIREAIAINPAAAHYHANLSNPLMELGLHGEAAGECEAAIRLQPQLAAAHYNLGLVRLRLRQWDAAAAACEVTLAHCPDHARAHLNLGLAREMQGRLGDAEACYRRGLVHAPRDAALWSNLGNLLRLKGDATAAVEALETAAECEPRDARLQSNLALALLDAGEIAAGIAGLQRCLLLDPAQPEVRSNLIFTALGLLGGEPLLREQLALWQRLHAEPLRVTWRPHTNERSPGRTLRVGFVSPDFREHAVGRTLLPVFLALDRGSFELTCYSEFAGDDAVTTQFRAASARWRVSEGVSDERLAAQVREDGIDVLVDLALHTSGNRLLVFARKPAPVQVAWLGYPGTTGLAAMDYAIADAQLAPQGSDAGGYSEKIIRLPDAWCCYTPPADSPDPNELPALANGCVTFGSLNKLTKMNEEVLALWARVLDAVDGSRLVLLARNDAQRERVLRTLGSHGVAAERVDFLRHVEAPRSHGELLARYHRLDIALDPFPYNGMTTTCEALWMGVPVIALAGRLPVSRASLSLLTAAGLPEWVGRDEAEYVRVAVDAARDVPGLAALRAGLRGKVAALPLADVPGFARHLESALRDAWRRWCSAA